jgi:hypothetical protein
LSRDSVFLDPPPADLEDQRRPWTRWPLSARRSTVRPPEGARWPLAKAQLSRASSCIRGPLVGQHTLGLRFVRRVAALVQSTLSGLATFSIAGHRPVSSRWVFWDDVGVSNSHPHARGALSLLPLPLTSIISCDYCWPLILKLAAVTTAVTPTSAPLVTCGFAKRRKRRR